MLEVILFLAITAIMMVASITVYVSTQESRIRQQSVLEVEGQGTHIIEKITQIIRRSEKILSPAVNNTGSILALQMSLNAEHPTIFAQSSTGNLLLVQKASLFELLSKRVTISHLTFRNINNNNIALSFDLSIIMPIVQSLAYQKHFEATATLYPDDQYESGGCSSCPLPSCVSHQYQWYECDSDICTVAPSTFSC